MKMLKIFGKNKKLFQKYFFLVKRIKKKFFLIKNFCFCSDRDRYEVSEATTRRPIEQQNDEYYNNGYGYNGQPGIK